MTLIAIEGLRGSGKTTLCKQLKDKYGEKIATLKFPTDAVYDILKWDNINYDMTRIEDVIKYNMLFVQDFVTSTDWIYNNQDKLIVFDRYILSNLAHFKYDIHMANESRTHWQGISKLLYQMFDNSLVLKPHFIIFLQGEYKQSEPKFDDKLYKDKEEELKWYYDTELSELKNRLNIPFSNVTSHKENTFEMVDSIIKRFI